jgi:hypothetical protein
MDNQKVALNTSTRPLVVDNTPAKPTLGRWLKEYWYVSLLVIAFIGFTISFILRSITPPLPPDSPNQWQGLAPGYSRLQDATTKLGEPVSQRQTPFGTEVGYKSTFPAIPHIVVVDSQNKVRFIKEFTTYDQAHTLKNYTDQFENFDLELFLKNNREPVKAYVFLEEGLVIVAHLNGGFVEQKWYFEPTDQETFLKSWGTSLSGEETGPEPGH